MQTMLLLFILCLSYWRVSILGKPGIALATMYVDSDEVSFEDLISIARDVQPTGDPFAVTFPPVSWRDGKSVGGL